MLFPIQTVLFSLFRSQILHLALIRQGIDRDEMMALRGRVCGFKVSVSVNKYGAALFALLSFFVEDSSAISTASAIIPRSSFGHIFVFRKTPSLRTRSSAAVIDEGD